jgi:hypothetical protein
MFVPSGKGLGKKEESKNLRNLFFTPFNSRFEMPDGVNNNIKCKKFEFVNIIYIKLNYVDYHIFDIDSSKDVFSRNYC